MSHSLTTGRSADKGGGALARATSPSVQASAAAAHPLAGPLSSDGPLDDIHDDVPASFHSQNTVRGFATIRAPKATKQTRPGYFDLKRLAAQADAADEVTTRQRKSGESRTASIYSVSRSSRASDDEAGLHSAASDTEGEGDDEETPSWLHNITARRSPLPRTIQPRPITQTLDFSPEELRDGGMKNAAPSAEGDSLHIDRSQDFAEDIKKAPQAPVEKLEEDLKRAREEAEHWKRAYDDEALRHAREMTANRKAHEAREAALLDILTAAGISKARAERALTHATTQSQVPVFLADERAAENVTRTRSPVHSMTRRQSQQQNAQNNKLPLVSPSHSLSGEDKLPASIMEAMLDEFLGDLPTPPALSMHVNGSSSQISGTSHAASLRSGTRSRSQSPSPSIRSNTSRATQGQPSAPSVSSSVNGFFTLNWRRKKPASNTSSIRDPGESKSTRVQSPELSTSQAGAAAATLSKTLQREGRRSTSGQVREPNVTRLPGLFGHQSTGTIRAKKRHAAGNSETKPVLTSTLARELEPMLAHDVRPPTLSLVAVGRGRLAPEEDKIGHKGERVVAASREDADEYQSSGDEFEVYGGKHLSPEELAQRVSSTIQRQREAGAEDSMLTDRYGFVYDATPADVRLLRRARKEAIHAPACLTGIRVGVRARGGTDSQSEDEEADDINLLGSDSDAEDGVQDGQLQTSPQKIEIGDINTVETKPQATLPQAGQTTGSHLFDPTPSPALNSVNTPGFLDLASAKPVVSASHLTAAAASQTSTKAGPTSPEVERLHFLSQPSESTVDTTHQSVAPAPATGEAHAANGTRSYNASRTVRRLLGQLQDMHSQQQQSQQVAWDAFLARRKAVLSEKSDAAAAASPASAASQIGVAFKAIDAVRKGSDALGLSMPTYSPASASVGKLAVQPRSSVPAEEEWTLGGLIGLGQMGTNTKDQQDLRKLIQGGIPLVYRPKIWYECSGAMEMAEPGRYEELLKEHEDEENSCTKQIDLDVGRTMPTNIYFAGDGPGVPKLRRLLVAFSWHNPKCGYCQGMNNLAATLLLTHATEEEAFWVLASIIERILPVDYFTSHLLTAQADQRVVIDLVHDQLPKLSRHIEELGVDLPAVTFAWFLSLYTDCLPVETLFRVWDVLFVDGASILFRVALAIFVMNEKDLLAAQSPSAFYSLMHSMTSHMFSADRLIALASDDLISSVKMAKIEERREKHIQDLCAELGLDMASLGFGGDEQQRTPSSSAFQ